jgi:hypothetical protein
MLLVSNAAEDMSGWAGELAVHSIGETDKILVQWRATLQKVPQALSRLRVSKHDW